MRVITEILDVLRPMPKGEALKTLRSVARLNRPAVKISNILDTHDVPEAQQGEVLKIVRGMVMLDTDEKEGVK